MQINVRKGAEVVLVLLLKGKNCDVDGDRHSFNRLIPFSNNLNLFLWVFFSPTA